MLKNYFKLTLRHLLKYRTYSFINIAGLAVGMACCILILLYVRDELRYDRFHERADRIYRLTLSTEEDGQPSNANTSFGQGPALAAAFPEVEAVVRFRKMGWGEKRVFAHNDNRFYEERFFYADKNVFEVFSFPFLRGNPQTALAEPFSIVITEAMSQKYFGHDNPLGETIALDPYNNGEFADYKITGVVKNLPHYSHIKFDFLASFASQKDLADMEGRRGWGLEAAFTYVLLKPSVSVESVQTKLPAFLEKHVGKDHWYSLHLQPLTDIRLHSKLRAELEPNGDIAYVYIFSAIAAFILLIACINFMNLATAQSAQRTKEVGMRKVVGAVRAELVKQFLIESLCLSLFALAIAFILIEASSPLLNSIVGKQIVIDYATDLPFVMMMLGLALVTGVVAGSYPAFFLSASRPIDSLTGKTSGGRKVAVILRKGLVVFQFAISVVLIVCTTVVYYQMQYVRTKNLGFDREVIVIAPLNDPIRNNYRSAKHELLQHPNLLAMTVTEQVPAKAGNGAGYKIDGWNESEGLTRFFVDQDFLKTYGIGLAAGRDFDEKISTDATAAFMVNEAFVRLVAWKSPAEVIGRSIRMSHARQDYDGRIIGVVKDFQLSSFRETVWPLVINVMPMNKLNFISFRIAPQGVTATLEHIRSVWSKFAPSYPLDYYFLDHDFARLHQADQQLGRVFQAFALLAIGIACLGLFGLAAFTAERRTKEIGVRKVLGATVTNVVTLLSKDFVKLVLLANLIAWPLAWYAMNKWLQSFAFRVEMEWWVFALAGGLALLIALLTVSTQAIKAALANPVESLRYE
ncbi:ABC transporter permease [candidate division KSB1 bacterium]|nr:ABC transporter permease [candidate division KSB1 bacterium]